MEPNTNTCPTCMGLPGALPVLNDRAIEIATILALALEGEINKRQFFFRKNYYYPDIACNFQINQYDKAGGVPFATGGLLTFKSGKETRTITLSRIHLENDPGKLYTKDQLQLHLSRLSITIAMALPWLRSSLIRSLPRLKKRGTT